MKTIGVALALCLTTSAFADRMPEPAATCHTPAAGAKITATFSSEVSLQDLATWVMGFTCKNVIIDAEALRYGAKLAVMTPKPMTAKQALALFVNSVQAVGLVAQVKADTIIVKLGPKTPPRTCTSPTSADPLATGDADNDAVIAQLNAGIKRIDDTHYEVKADVIDKLLANPMVAAKGARVVPAVKSGKPDGFKLYAIRPDSFYAHIGLRNGDSIQSVNGTALTDADKALELYSALRGAKLITIELVRESKPVTLQLNITK